MTKHKKRGERESDGVRDSGVTLPNQEICESTKVQSGSTNVQASWQRCVQYKLIQPYDELSGEQKYVAYNAFYEFCY